MEIACAEAAIADTAMSSKKEILCAARVLVHRDLPWRSAKKFIGTNLTPDSAKTGIPNSKFVVAASESNCTDLSVPL